MPSLSVSSCQPSNSYPGFVKSPLSGKITSLVFSVVLSLGAVPVSAVPLSKLTVCIFCQIA